MSSLSLILVLMSASLPASEVLEHRHGLVGHPRDRFPLKVYAQSATEASLDAAVRDAVAGWNHVFQKTFKMAAFEMVAREDLAQVDLQFVAPVSGKLMGETLLDTDRDGNIKLPVRITLSSPQARGETSRETILFQVAAHELGHALGLPHVHDPASIMCCVKDSIDFNDPEVRDRYVQARRHPDINSVVPQLTAHYEAFWKK